LNAISQQSAPAASTASDGAIHQLTPTSADEPTGVVVGLFRLARLFLEEVTHQIPDEAALVDVVLLAVRLEAGPLVDTVTGDGNENLLNVPALAGW